MELKLLFKDYFNEIIFPQNTCLVCGSIAKSSVNSQILFGSSCEDKLIVRRINGLANLCPNCKKGLELPTSNHCYVCHKPLVDSSVKASVGTLICPDCQDHQTNFLTFNRSAILYNDFAKELISLYKYKGKESILPLFINLLAITYDHYYLNEKIDLITYVPIHQNRLEIRGFNQAEMLADGLHRYANKPIIETLLKDKDTKKQSKQHKWERLSEIKGSFVLAEGVSQQLGGKNVLIIDDIYTTGFTMNECASVLKQAGVGKVFGLTLARAFVNNT